MGKKGQLTIFIIIGIVLVLVFGIVFWFRGALVENATDGDSHVQEFKRSVDVYVTNCLELLGADAIQKIGEQGGDLFDIICDNGDCTVLDNVRWVERVSGQAPPASVQLGVDYLTHICDGRTCYVSYGIRRNRAPPTTYSFDDGQYPHPAFNFSLPNDPNYVFASYYGDNALRKLCDWEGPNTRDPGRKISIPCDLQVFDTVYPAYLKNFSMQEQLAVYVEKHMSECAVLTPFIKQGYDFDVGEPDVTVVLGESDVSFSLEYPLLWGNSARGNSSRTSSVLFTKSLPIRLKRVYEFANRLVDEDISRLDFNLTVDSNGDPVPNRNMFSQVPGYDASLRFKKVKNACGGCTTPVFTTDSVGGDLCPTPSGCNPSFDDIIEIRDTSSQIGGKPFSFNFAVQNRRPVLDKITQVQNAQTSQIGALVEPKWCQPFELHIRAKDPDDEDELHVRVFSPSGSLDWNENLRYNCQNNMNYATCWDDLFNVNGWDVSKSLISNLVYRQSGAYALLRYNGAALPGTIAYHPFVDADVILDAPVDAVNFMSSQKDVRVVVLDEELLEDRQDFNYRCCALTTLQPQSSCYSGLLVDWTP